MKNPYQNLLNTIPVPEELEDRVLSAARRQTAPVGKPLRRRGRRMLQAAVCGACALTLVLGTLTLRKPEAAGGSPAQGDQDGALVLAPSLSFGLTAYAAETGETYAPNANQSLALSSSGSHRNDLGHFTGILFQVTGENIQSLTMSLSQGQLYSSREITGLSEEEMEALLAAPTAENQPPTGFESFDGGPYSTEEIFLLGSEITVDYDPEIRYGFWTDGEVSGNWLMDPTVSQRSIDKLDGAVLSVTAHFTDGSQGTKSYTLSTGLFTRKTESDGTISLLPQLSGDNSPTIYGVYVVDQDRSRFLRWPLGDNTKISMSAPFGSRTNPGGQSAVFHDGLDIPAPKGTQIAAAAGGTVIKAAFDPKLGNLLVIDHGDGLETVYGCCSELLVKSGDNVSAGDVIAAVGSSGKSTGPHLHFGVRQNGQAQNPVAYFDSAVRATLSVG